MIYFLAFIWIIFVVIKDLKVLSFNFWIGEILAFTAWVLWKWLKSLGVNYVSVSVVLIVMLLEPVFQIIAAYFIVDEKLSIINIFWIWIVLVMTVLISRKK